MKNRASIALVLLCLVSLAVGLGSTRMHVKKTHVDDIDWYASFPDALAEAKQTHKPILLLSMFGKLDEAMPCANARTLRATLFKDPAFHELVTHDVIPAWEMVRPVPHITIDLGDGKAITRTVRGNAVMYLCNSDGRVVDAYPGIYTAGDFLPMVKESIRELSKVDAATVLAYHQALERPIPRSFTTLGKAVMETPTLEMVGAAKFNPPAPEERDADPARRAFLTQASRLSDLSLTPMSPNQAVTQVTGSPISDWSSSALVQQVLKNDSATNMTRVRPVIHYWMASLKDLPTPEQARDAVLQTILKIPFKDPYFGLKDVLLPGTPG